MTSIPFPIPRRDNDMLRVLSAPQGRPLLLTGGTVVTGNELLGGWQNADVLIGGNVIVGIGPGLLTAAGDDNMIVVDCAGTLVLPAATDFTAPHTSATLTPGQSADIVVLRLADTPETPAGAAPARGSHLDLLITAGQVRLWDGRPLDRADTPTTPAPASEPAHDPSHPFVGVWVDDHGFVRQELLPDGRYDEARGSAPAPTRAATGSPGIASTTSTTWASGPSANSTTATCTTPATASPAADHSTPTIPSRPIAHRPCDRPPHAHPGVPVRHPLVPSRHAAKTATPGTPPGWAPTTATITLLTSLDVLVVGQVYTVLALLHPMALSLHATPEQVTWTATSFGLAYAAGFLVVGPLTDRYGPRVVMTTGLVAATAATAAVSTAPDLTWAIALRIVQGLTAAAFAPAAFSYIAHHLAPQRRAMALACVTSGMLGAAVLMQIAAQAVAAGPGWRAVFLLSAALMALSLLPVHRTLRPTPRQDTGGLLHAFAAMPRLLRRGRLLALYAATVTLMAGFVVLYTAVSVAGPPGIAGNPTAILTLRASALPALVAVPLLAPVLSRLAAPRRLVLALGVAAVTVTAASLLGGHTILLAVALLLFVGAVATAAPAVVETVNATAPHARGAAVALYACSMFIGASLGPQLAGALTGQGFGTILRVAAAGLVLGAALALPALRRRHPQ